MVGQGSWKLNACPMDGGMLTGECVHAHAETQIAPDGRVKFAVYIAQLGIYKAWGQFQRQGQVFTIPAVLQVD